MFYEDQDLFYAGLDDVKLAYEGEITEDAEPRVQYLLKVTSARLTAMIPTLPARITAGDVSPLLPQDMVVRAVMRQLRNPSRDPSERMTQTQSAGPFSTTVTYGSAYGSSSGQGLFDESDLALLYEPTTPAVGTIQVGIPLWQRPTVRHDGVWSRPAGWGPYL